LKFNPVYFAEMKNLQPFIENDEILEIQLWDTSKRIENFDPVDRKILDYIK
jgi:8-oxo-dGTP diphosphatase